MVRGNYHNAEVIAVILSALLAIVSGLFPPAVNFDPGIGMLELRTLEEGGPANSIVAPDPTDISRDRTEFIAYWSPGQYVIPGLFTVFGVRLGPAISITAGLALLSCLLGWIRVFKHFAVSPQTAILAVILMATFSYSMVNFRFFYGGEPLVQAVTPWLILAGRYVPVIGPLEAAVLAALAILFGFFAKLTGMLIAGAALAAGSMVVLLRLRRITKGMISGAVGAVLAVGFLYFIWFSRGSTAATEGSGFVFRPSFLLFSAAAPWGAGVSWIDNISDWVSFNPLRAPWLLLPPVVVFASLIALAAARRTDVHGKLGQLIEFTSWFYIIYVLAMAFLYMHGGSISVEERHFRSPGILIFACALAVAHRLPARHALRVAAIAFCGLMALHGVYWFIYRLHARDPRQIDATSGTYQLRVDERALAFARGEFQREGRAALFLIPFPDAATAFPLHARILTAQFDAEPEAFIRARKYSGTVPGDIYVLMPTRIARSAKGPLILRQFTDYSPDAWMFRRIGATTVYSQRAAPVPQTIK